MIELKLKPREDRRLRAGHLWVYSNEIEAAEGFRQAEPGSLCRVLDDRGRPLGLGYLNPHTLIAVRLLTGSAQASIDADWFSRRLEAALALRARGHATPHYRLVFGEADGLPGLVVDRYDDLFAVQISTAGMERLKPALLAALQRVFSPRGIYFANDLPMRATEGLSLQDETVGEVPEQVELDESGVRFRVPLAGGQKTGWFYDQRQNRDRWARYAAGGRVLDVFSYAGGWALRSLAAGAESATCIDRSEPALAAAADSAGLNGMSLEALQGEALDVMKRLRTDGRSFDVVVVDPPALVKRKKDFQHGLEHYAALNRAAIQLLAPDAILISCSCSHHVAEADLQRVLLREARTANRRMQILETGAQGPDHPVHPAIPETRYLKGIVSRLHTG
ncbi:class I SAM-dependent rRNA methyltransferase [Flagellatimonas centrodinii]|uniref:class I SAM-dependent rRNA methyltransferase n=1 Tax=Flagellatimonas centrodinii TaxID=2806210 RepID=UPI001FF022AC|nr:class I SAM-dependent rRNA methyltransferase [Flagellatimonas centrodinii]ULQ45476.1 class I SAM-dependent rRNA methyltransferase [Flagellatimonas centrodinii]